MNEISIGDENQYVVLLQQFLSIRGFYLDADGVFGINTKNALIAYQTAHQLPATGIADETMITLIQLPTKIDTFCLAIKSREGFIAPCPQYPQGTPAWQNNNIGNLTWDNQPHAIQNGRFAKFSTYTYGYNALRSMLIRACSGHSAIYNAKGTLYTFFDTYAPTADSNDPKSYADFVISRLGVSVDTILEDLLN